MDNLKKTLFEHTYHRLTQYRHDVKEFGELSAPAVNAKTQFKTLYGLIEAAGLEDEYLAWREAMQEEG